MLKYPLDRDGFAIPINIEDLCDIMDTYNMAVIQVLDDEECETTVNAMWEEMNVTNKLDKDDSRTWENENWPTPNSRFLSNNYATHEIVFRNSVHPKVVEVFSTLFGTDDLITTIDNWGIKRGTHFDWGTRYEWRDDSLRLHWDVDIYNYVPRLYQSFIALVDSDYSVGSFACVPGSANELNEWKIKNKPIQNKIVPPYDDMQKRIQKIPLRKGCLVVWDRGTAHANFANACTDKCRIVQYMRMLPRKRMYDDSQSIVPYWKKNKELKCKIAKLNWTQKERKMLGLI
jgi:hypothetical protein